MNLKQRAELVRAYRWELKQEQLLGGPLGGDRLTRRQRRQRSIWDAEDEVTPANAGARVGADVARLYQPPAPPRPPARYDRGRTALTPAERRRYHTPPEVRDLIGDGERVIMSPGPNGRRRPLVVRLARGGAWTEQDRQRLDMYLNRDGSVRRTPRRTPRTREERRRDNSNW